ncbi:unnamed protein product [Musa banksii]
MAETTKVMTSINFENNWIVDSRCSHHLTSDDAKFTNLHRYEGTDTIIMADNIVHQVKNEGTIIISDKDNDPITLKSVYHVPDIKKNLFSIVNTIDARNYVLFNFKSSFFII